MLAHKMTNRKGKILSEDLVVKLLEILEERFRKNMNRHESLKWPEIMEKLKMNPGKLWSLWEMERTGGEPDVVSWGSKTDEYFFCDCSTESPSGRRSLCYDDLALTSRKEFKPKDSASKMAESMGITMLNVEEYESLQKFGNFDTKTSSWIRTPQEMRKLGGALFADYRFGRTFIYHNGAESYYAGRGFRGWLKI